MSARGEEDDGGAFVSGSSRWYRRLDPKHAALHLTCPVLQMELVGVRAVEGERDLAVGADVRVRRRDLQYEHAGGRVLHHHLGVDQLEQGGQHAGLSAIV